MIHSLCCLFLCLLFPSGIKAEDKEEAESKVILLHTDHLRYDEYRHPGAQILTGNVQFRHEDVLMYCDSACFYQATNSFNAYGHVKMLQGDIPIAWTMIAYMIWGISLKEESWLIRKMY